ncbi:unnamed protein product [Cuscuta campestris]|uniref:Protein Iojap, chloroplastic n=1 Tax=Cuscuta campestris TaxID=132261 RepID=A0A484MY49_9ASTE|nr:unnamed protein product [Cuscuta campestris]
MYMNHCSSLCASSAFSPCRLSNSVHPGQSRQLSFPPSSNPTALHFSALNYTPLLCPGLISAPPCSAVSSRSGSSISDDMLDELIEKYGELVFRRSDHKPASEEVEDDAVSLSFALAAANVANDMKAADIKVLFVKPLVYWTRFFIIATAFSRPQIDAIMTKIRDLGEKQFGTIASGDLKPNSWTLLDFGDVVVHIFLPEQREFYDLETFYGNATPIQLPCENQQLQHSQNFEPGDRDGQNNWQMSR